VDRGIALSFLDPGARGWVVSTTPRPLYPRERPGTHYTGDWVGPMAGLDVCEKSRHHRDFFFAPRTVQPVASRYRLSYLAHLNKIYTYIIPRFYLTEKLGTLSLQCPIDNFTLERLSLFTLLPFSTYMHGLKKIQG
jgi:hypothetical protein